MADAFTQASTLSSDTGAYEALAYFALRPQLMFDAVASVKPTHETHRGSSVTFTIYGELAAQTTTLSETADPDAIAPTDSTLVVTPAEKGAVLKTTAKLRVTSFLDIDADMANLIGYNAGLSLDTLARTAIAAGTNVRYAGNATSRTTIDAADTFAAANVRRARTDLVGASVPTTGGALYWGFIHPDVTYDLRTETGTASWRDPHVYSSPEAIWSGEVGAFEGVRWVETPRCTVNTDASNGAGAAGTVDVYETYVCGFQALALAHANGEGYARYPTIVKGPVVDALQRIQPIGWKWMGQHKVFREASLRRIESASSIGANT